jgi:hypothetical protein
MRQMGIYNPQAVLRVAVSDNRVLGIVMILLGFAFSAPAALLFPKLNAQCCVVAASAGIFLIAPGILYQIAASGMKHGAVRAGRITIRVSIVQSILSLLVFPFAILFGVREPVLIPVAVNLFFVPAILAQALNIRRALRAIRLLPSTGRAFEAIDVRPAAVLPLQPIETDLEK